MDQLKKFWNFLFLTQVELTGTNGSFKNIKLVWLTAFRLVQMAGTGACHYAGTGVATTPAREPATTPARGLPLRRNGDLANTTVL